MNNKKSAKKFLKKVINKCRNGVIHPQIEYELLAELVNLLNNSRKVLCLEGSAGNGPDNNNIIIRGS